MNAQATKLESAENDLKQLMADVSRAMEKAQEAVAKIASKAAARQAPRKCPTTQSRGLRHASYVMSTPRASLTLNAV